MMSFRNATSEPSAPVSKEERDPGATQPKTTRLGGDMILITKSTVLEGTLRSESPIEVEGFVKGTIQSKSDLTISGRMEGDIKVGSLTADGATILGDISCATSAAVLAGSQVQGNIDAEKVVVSACVKGDITARESVVLESDAVVLGNIDTKYFQVVMGAYVNGIVTTTSDVDQTRLFDRIEEGKTLTQEAVAAAAAAAPVPPQEAPAEPDGEPDAESKADAEMGEKE